MNDILVERVITCVEGIYNWSVDTSKILYSERDQLIGSLVMFIVRDGHARTALMFNDAFPVPCRDFAMAITNAMFRLNMEVPTVNY